MTISGQEILGTLTPGMVSQTSSNKNLQGDNDLTRARKIFLAGGTQFPGGIKLMFTQEKRIVSFEKNHSRQGLTDGSYILPAGSPVFVVPGEPMPRYPYCLNIFSSFAVLPVEIEYVEVEAKNDKDIVINNNVYIKREQGLDVGDNVSGRVVRGSFREVPQQHPSMTTSQYSTSNCNLAYAKANQVVVSYQNGLLFSSRAKAQRKIEELKLQYPGCLDGFVIERANNGARWLQNNAIPLTHLVYDIATDRNNVNNYVRNITNVTNNHGNNNPGNGDYNPGNNNPSGGSNQGGYNPGNGNYNAGGANASGYNPRAVNVMNQTGGMFGSYIR
jgi:hypothetical protein